MKVVLGLGWLVAALLAVPAAALTCIRLFGIGSGPALRLEAFTPLAIPAYAVVLVWLLAWVVRRRVQRRIAAAVRKEAPPRPVTALVPVPLVLLVLGVLVLHLVWFSPLVLGTPPPARTGAAQLVVMNSNLFEGQGDMSQVYDQVKARGVDLLVLEEVTPDDVAALDRAGITKLLPYRIGVPEVGVHGTMVLSAQRLTGAVRLPTTFESWRVTVGDGLTLLAVHPVAPVTIAGWRADQAAILAAARADHPDLLVGDFNATDDHEVMRTLASGGWDDAAQLVDAGFAPTWPANGLGPLSILPRLVAIDHVLVGPTMTAVDTDTVHIDGTDHAALVAVVAPRA